MAEEGARKAIEGDNSRERGELRSIKFCRFRLKLKENAKEKRNKRAMKPE